MDRITSVNEYIKTKTFWTEEISLLRDILLGTPVKESMKWSAPAYTFNNENIIGLVAFKNYVGLWFHQGVFLMDENKLLINANRSKTKGLRQWRFSKISEIEKHADLIELYVLEAIENQKAGLRIEIERGRIVKVPVELESLLEMDDELKIAFYNLSQSKRNEYSYYIFDAKQEKTKQSRLVKIYDMILQEKGLNDKYKS